MTQVQELRYNIGIRQWVSSQLSDGSILLRSSELETELDA